MGSGGAGLFRSVSYTVLKRVFKLQPGSSSTGAKVGRARAVRDPRPKAGTGAGVPAADLLTVLSGQNCSSYCLPGMGDPHPFSQRDLICISLKAEAGLKLVD